MLLKKGDSVLVIGSGPIRIGQGCEFDYSCTQACRALRQEGLKVILVNPNPATIMTDPQTADTVYIEPLDATIVTQIIERERPTALLATMGGQEGLNLALELEKRGVLARCQTLLLGISTETIEIAEDREKFKELLREQNLGAIKGCVIAPNSLSQLDALTQEMRFPVIIRASFTLGGQGGCIVESREDLKPRVLEALQASGQRAITLEESIVGWKEFELEVMTDDKGTFVVVAAVENINPMGVHTGDSVTVVPPFTLRDSEFQNMRDAAKKIFRALGMRIGGANIQFAVHPQSGEMVVIEMNPRVSRSSALVSKATGYPIAHISTKLALGYSLDALTNEITQKTSAAYEPVIDYVAVKIPRFDFEKIAPAEGALGIAMKSVGEVLAFGSSLNEAMTKAWRSLEKGFECAPDFNDWLRAHPEAAQVYAQSNNIKNNPLTALPSIATLPLVKTRIQQGESLVQIHKDTGIGMFFLCEWKELFDAETEYKSTARVGQPCPKARVILEKSGYTSKWFEQNAPESLRANLQKLPLRSFSLIDSCAGEFEAKTPYYFSTHSGTLNENRLDQSKKRVVIIGSGPNRIGQGIEFDYACVHAVQAVKKMGMQAIMVNCNPETVSTDYLTADKLYMEPIDEDGIGAILEAEKPHGVLLQFGGQSPLKLAHHIDALGYTVLGSSLKTIDLCENRHDFETLLAELNILSPSSKSICHPSEIEELCTKLDFPILVRPSYVIGGQGMTVVYDKQELLNALSKTSEISLKNPVILQEFLEDGVEFDVDLLADGVTTEIVGVLKHLDPPGIHSGDSICEWISQNNYPTDVIDICRKIALHSKTIGLINIQCVTSAGQVYVLEANPRSSRTVPFLAKLNTSSDPVIQRATRLCLGEKLAPAPAISVQPSHPAFAFKFPVFPYAKFEKLTRGPGPEMHSLGEVMGLGSTRIKAFLKGALAAGWKFSASTELTKSPELLPLKIAMFSPNAKIELSPLCEELEFLLAQKKQKLEIVCLENSHKNQNIALPHLLQCDALFIPDYFKSVAKDPTLKVTVAQAIGKGVPVATCFETAKLILSSFCLIASSPGWQSVVGKELNVAPVAAQI